MIGKVRYGSLPFEEQIEHFRAKTDIPTERWADVWRGAHNQGFMVAGATRDDLLADFRKAVDRAISEGQSLGAFQNEFERIVAHYGWVHNGAPSWRAQVIYETNLRQSYSAGRESQIEALKHLRPYGIYKHSGSEHPRLEHLSWNNLVLPLDDPWWETHTPINGYGCKCKKLSASAQTLKRLGLEVSPSPKIDYVEWVDKVTGEAHQVPKGISPGFDYRPLKTEMLTEKISSHYTAKLSFTERLPKRVVDSALSTVKGVNAQGISDVLKQLDSPELALFEKVLDAHPVKSLILKQSELVGGAKSRAIQERVEAYLVSGSPRPMALYLHRTPSRVNGFTSSRWNHVVVKAKSTDSLKKVSAQDITKAVETAMNQMEAGQRQFSMSHVTRNLYGDSSRVLTTWAHEVGHQLHFKAGSPKRPELLALTHYAEATDYEWWAEHFVAWLFAPVRLKSDYPEIYEAIDAMMGTLVKRRK